MSQKLQLKKLFEIISLQTRSSVQLLTLLTDTKHSETHTQKVNKNLEQGQKHSSIEQTLTCKSSQ